MSVPSRHLVIRPISRGQDATIARSWASSSALSGLGKLNKTMCWRVICSSSVELEVLAHLPLADVLPLRRRVLGDGGRVAGELGALHLDQVIDDDVAERLAVEGVLRERVDRVAQ